MKVSSSCWVAWIPAANYFTIDKRIRQTTNFMKNYAIASAFGLVFPGYFLICVGFAYLFWFCQTVAYASVLQIILLLVFNVITIVVKKTMAKILKYIVSGMTSNDISGNF